MSSDRDGSSVDEKGAGSAAPGGATKANHGAGSLRDALTAEAVELGKQLGESVVTEGLSRKKLTELVEQLRSKARQRTGAGEASREDEADEEDDEANDGNNAAPTAPELRYFVADRRSITSLKGIIAAGELVQPKDVSGGAERLEHLASRGVLVKR